MACTSSADQYAAAMKDGDCARIGDAALRADCLAWHGRCEAVEGQAGWECWFRRAEAEGDGALCAKAGDYADDCRMHLLTTGFRDWAPRDAGPGDADALAATHIVAAGFAVEDLRPWSAWYRYLLERSRPFDRTACAKVADPARREACLRTGLVAWQDRLNMARDRRLWPCDGGPAPELLQHSPDPELDAATAARTDLCP